MREVAEAWGFRPGPGPLQPYLHLGLSFTSRCYPGSLTAEHLVAAATHTALLFLLDDVCFDRHDVVAPAELGLPPGIGRSPARVRGFWDSANAAFRGAQPASAGAAGGDVRHVFFDLGCRFRRLGTGDWFDGFAGAVETYSRTSTLLLLQQPCDGAGPGPGDQLAAFARIRCANSGAAFVGSMMECCTGTMVPAPLRRHPAIGALHRLFMEHTSFVNDVFSFHKEQAQEGGAGANLVRFFMDAATAAAEEPGPGPGGMSVPAAVRRALRHVDAIQRRFLEVERRLPRWQPPAPAELARRYVDGLKDMMAGNFFWSLETVRYRSPESVFPELRREVGVGCGGTTAG